LYLKKVETKITRIKENPQGKSKQKKGKIHFHDDISNEFLTQKQQK